MNLRRVLLVIALGAALLVPALRDPATATMLPAGFTENILGHVADPTSMEFAPDGRLFVTEQKGRVRVVKNGAVLPTPFLSVTVDSQSERGLLGVTFDPNFASNQYVYVFYTKPGSPARNQVSRFTANGDVAVPGSEVVLLTFGALDSTRHNGGAIHFGPDGKLYIAHGENQVPSNSQSLGNLFGKILRINADGSIPADNPFVSRTSGINQAIWAIGLRNPFTFAFQPGTGRMFINDVGQSSKEEINDGIAGSNYGWPVEEGPSTNPAYRSPIFSYGHGTGPTTGCAITGGTFYNPPNVLMGDSVGQYFFADLCSRWIRKFNPGTGQATGFALDAGTLVDLDTGADGALYTLQRLAPGDGGVFRIAPEPVAPPPPPPPPPPGNVLHFGAAADAYVAQGTPGTNFGSSVDLRVDGSPRTEGYLRFNVSGITTPVLRAKLRLFANDSSNNGPTVAGTTAGWSESGITWANRPPATSGVVANVGNVANNTAVEYDVTSLVNGNGSFNFKLDPEGGDAVEYNTKEAGNNRPDLIVTTGAVVVPSQPIPLFPGGQGTIQSVFGPRHCLDVSFNNPANGTQVWSWPCDRNGAQLWGLEEVGSSGGQPVYRIRRSALHEKCLDVPASSADNGTRMITWDCHDGPNQRWQIVRPASLGTPTTPQDFQLVSMVNGKCIDIDIAVSGGGQNAGTPVQQWQCLGANQANQLWNFG